MSKTANISKEEKKAEALRRMKKLGIFENTIDDFENDDKISISEDPVGAYYYVDSTMQKVIQDFEMEYNALVYTGIKSITTIGTMFSFLFVSDYPKEWDTEISSYENPNDLCLAYVYNADDPDCSEIGDIGIRKTLAAGLRRIW